MIIQLSTLPEGLKISKPPRLKQYVYYNFQCFFPIYMEFSCPSPQQLHSQNEIKPHNLANDICSKKQMTKLSCTFATCFPELTTAFFDPLLECLKGHNYGASTDVTNMHKFRNVHLVDFFMHSLKSKHDYMKALERVLKLDKLKEYLSKFVVVFSGDHLSQIFPRQIVHEILNKYVANLTSNAPVPQEELLSLMPLIGLLYIDLNADEDLLLNYHPFIKSLYELLFPNRILAGKPKPWRIQFILEIIYGGWTLIRRSVKAVFQKCKDVQYGTLLNLLSNSFMLILNSF